jgi:type III restriction enzyme
VGMLSEGWDARTVTHVTGLRAFTSQLLCEQVIGRGLRRTSYEVDATSGLFEPESVNVFGVPFTFLPHEGGEGTPPPPPSPKTRIEPDARKAEYAITWPNVIRVDHQYRPHLALDLSGLPALVLDAADVTLLAELAPVIEGKPDISQISEIDLLALGRRFRTQQIVFATASNVFDQIQPDWQGNREQLLAQLVRLVEQVITGDRITVHPALYDRDPLRRRIVLTMHMSRLVQHIWQALRFANAEALAPVFDTEHPLRSTADMRTWATSKPCHPTVHSHINMCVYDSTWEATEAYQLERSPHVASWVKNDHLGFEIHYTYRGVVHKYLPDFLVGLVDGRMLILEVKGQDDDEQRTKRQFLDEWVRAVTTHGGFGAWSWAVSRRPLDVLDILAEQAVSGVAAAGR